MLNEIDIKSNVPTPNKENLNNSIIEVIGFNNKIIFNLCGACDIG
jgi:hypothetical protein